MNNNNISMAVIRRLPKYHRCLGVMIKNGKKRISSKDLSEVIGFSASQIRQDFNNFGAFGQQGYGYNIKELYNEIEKIIGLEKDYNMIVIGGGNLAYSLVGYGFGNLGFKFKAIFDNDKSIIGKKIYDINVYDVNILETFISKNKVDIAIITTPSDVAQNIADRLCISGVRGIWNFAPIDLNVPEDIMLENVHMVDSLMTLAYLLNDKK